MLTRLGRRLDGDAGISLVEMLVALLILGVAMTAMTSSVYAALASSRGAQDQVNASQRITEVVEDLLGRPLSQIAPATQDGVTTPAYPPVTLRSVTYSVATQVRWVDDPCNGSAVPAAGAADPRRDYLRMQVSVSWTVGGTPRSLDTTMLRTPTSAEQPRVRSATC
ncbi:MAG TPA: prepilin-type N-terminal cleavage/methylation domain-containing protein [Egibacteraceae bacterium]|nr:prepilin-type N-terminal cleavage/methylation domain-containing protein [Egibacteraceae bacterium]